MDMNGVNQSGYAQAAAYESQAAAGTEKSKGTKPVGGRTVGNPKLSDKAAKYYEELKKKYSNMEFILVSPDKKEEAERNKGMYGSSKSLLVLIDSDKIEQMAEDETVRKQYESILNSATVKMTQMKSELGQNASAVKSYGMTFDNHGNASFFAVIDKSLAAQKERIADKKAENIRTKKENAQKAEKKKAQEKRNEALKSQEKEDTSGKDTVTVTAKTWDELLHKIDDVITAEQGGKVKTPEEQQVGQHFDYTL